MMRRVLREAPHEVADALERGTKSACFLTHLLVFEWMASKGEQREALEYAIVLAVDQICLGNDAGIQRIFEPEQP
jgi:hypothetical protein